MRFKYIINVLSDNHKKCESVWSGEEFENDESESFKKAALKKYKEFENICRSGDEVRLIKAETDSWYWNTKKVIMRKESKNGL